MHYWCEECGGDFVDGHIFYSHSVGLSASNSVKRDVAPW